MEQWITLVLMGFVAFRLYKVEQAIRADKQITIAPVAYEKNLPEKEVVLPEKEVMEPIITQMEQDFNKVGVIDASFDEDFGI
jgi:hypothetical protein